MKITKQDYILLILVEDDQNWFLLAFKSCRKQSCTKTDINFLKPILDKEKDELMYKVFQAQKETPTSGDFVKLVKKDMQDLRVSYEEVAQHTKVDLKKKKCN